MPLILLDLDNTLVDRAAAFATWAAKFVSSQGGKTEDVVRIIAFDGDGLAARETVATQIATRLQLAPQAADEVLQVMRAGLVEQMTLHPSVAAALRAAREAGWRLSIVTNGTTHQQEHKIRHLGLDALVDAWVVSETVSVRKPDPRIFEIGAQAARADLVEAWMIGDSAEADIAGAVAAGVSSAWIRRDRSWSRSHFAPTFTADTVADAIDRIVQGHPADPVAKGLVGLTGPPRVGTPQRAPRA